VNELIAGRLLEAWQTRFRARERDMAQAWVKLGLDYLNLEHVVSGHFQPDDDGVLVATVEMVTGTVKHYRGEEAEVLRAALQALCPPAVA
jgi:hypothetical protein